MSTTARDFIAAGWKYSHAISNQDVCGDRSCFRCRLADLLLEAEKREKISPAKPKPDSEGLIVELGAFGVGKAAIFRWVMMKLGETIGSTLAMFILAAAIAAGANEKMEINIQKVLRIMRELADQFGVDMSRVSVVPTEDDPQ